MIATPASRDAAGPCRTTSRPSIRSVPESGRCTPPRIFTSVDLPAPFSPTSACASPPYRPIETSSSAWIAPNAFDACRRERIGEGSVIAVREEGVPKHSAGTPRAGSRSPCSFLEVELVDVRLVEHERRPEQHGALRPDLVLPELPGRKGLPDLPRDRAGGVVDRRVGREEAEVGRVPELEALDRAVLDVLAQRVGRSEARELDLAAVLRRVEDGGRGRDPDGGRRDNPLQVRVLLQEALRDLRRDRRVVVAVHDVDELHLREL